MNVTHSRRSCRLLVLSILGRIQRTFCSNPAFSTWGWLQTIVELTSMHSSRMRTDRLLAVCLLGGASWMYPPPPAAPPPRDRMTARLETACASLSVATTRCYSPGLVFGGGGGGGDQTGIPYHVTFLIMHLMLPTCPLPVNRQTPVKTLPSTNMTWFNLYAWNICFGCNGRSPG